jgi:hypothetical protein
MWREAGAADPVFTDTLELDLGDRGPVDGRPEASRRPHPAGRYRIGFAKR